MEKLDVKDIDFNSLKKFKYQGSQSTMFVDETTCYKIFKGIYPDEIDSMYKKILEMDGIQIKDVLLPKSIIMDNQKLVGITLDYFQDSQSVFRFFTNFNSRYVSCNELFDIINKISLSLRNIHKKGIICQDLSLCNVLINSQGEIRFCDMDSCTYKNYSSPYIAGYLDNFLVNYRNFKTTKITQNNDRLSLLLEFYFLLYLKEMQNLSKKDYNYLGHLKTMENAQVIRKKLLNLNKTIEEVPYMDELICLDDDFLIDRCKQVNLTKKLSYFKYEMIKKQSL